MNLIDLKERIAITEAFSPEERDLLLGFVNALCDMPRATKPAAGAAIGFRIRDNIVAPGRVIVEIVSGDRICAVMSSVRNGVRLLSNHIASLERDDGVPGLPVPAITIRFVP